MIFSSIVNPFIPRAVKRGLLTDLGNILLTAYLGIHLNISPSNVLTVDFCFITKIFSLRPDSMVQWQDCRPECWEAWVPEFNPRQGLVGVWFMVLASRASGCLFGHPNPYREPLRTPKSFCVEFLKNLNLKLIIDFFHLLTIPMTLLNDIIPYFDEFIHVYGWNMSILWSPLKIWMPKNFTTTANFRHPVSKSWLRHWFDSSIN